MEIILSIGMVLFGILGFTTGWNIRGYIEKKNAEAEEDELLLDIQKDYNEREREKQLEDKYNKFIDQVWDEYDKGE